MRDASTADLVAAVRSGDQRAWDELVERYSGLVWSVARAHRLGPSDAADVFQTTWLRLVEHVDRIREPQHLGGWLSSTARHECLRTLRAAGRELLVDDVGERVEADGGPRAPGRLGAEPPASPESVLLASEQRAEVLAAFGQLSERCRGLLRLLATDPAPSYAEVSASLDMPIGSIGPTRGRCISHLRALLGVRATDGT